MLINTKALVMTDFAAALVFGRFGSCVDPAFLVTFGAEFRVAEERGKTKKCGRGCFVEMATFDNAEAKENQIK